MIRRNRDGWASEGIRTGGLDYWSMGRGIGRTGSGNDVWKGEPQTNKGFECILFSLLEAIFAPPASLPRMNTPRRAVFVISMYTLPKSGRGVLLQSKFPNAPPCFPFSPSPLHPTCTHADPRLKRRIKPHPHPRVPGGQHNLALHRLLGVGPVLLDPLEPLQDAHERVAHFDVGELFCVLPTSASRALTAEAEDADHGQSRKGVKTYGRRRSEDRR